MTDPQLLAEADQSIAATSEGIDKLLATSRKIRAQGCDRTVAIAALNAAVQMLIVLDPNEIARGLAVTVVRLEEAQTEIERLQALLDGAAR